MQAVLEAPAKVEGEQAEPEESLVDKLFAEINEERPALPVPFYDGYTSAFDNFPNPENILMCYRREEIHLVRAAVLSRIKWYLGEQKKPSKWSNALYVWEREGYQSALEDRIHVYHVSITAMRNQLGYREFEEFRESYFEYLRWLKKTAGGYSDNPPPDSVLKDIKAYPPPEVPEPLQKQEAA